MRASGRINFVGLLLGLGAAAGFYWLIIFGPLFLDNFDVKNAVNVAYNQLVYMNDIEPNVRSTMLRTFASSSYGTHPGIDPVTGEQTEVPGLPISNDDIFIEVNPGTKKVTIRVEYDRTVRLKPLDKTRRIHFRVEKIDSSEAKR